MEVIFKLLSVAALVVNICHFPHSIPFFICWCSLIFLYIYFMLSKPNLLRPMKRFNGTSTGLCC